MKKKTLRWSIFILFLYAVGFNGIYKYNNEKVVEYIKDNKADNSRSMCAWYSMKAIRNGGCYNCYIYPGYAYNKILPQLGFKEIPIENYIPKKGDISVLPQNSHSVFGHIAIYDGTKWISDFEQKSIYPGTTYKEVGKYQIFRLEDGWHWAHLKLNFEDLAEYIKLFINGYNKIKWNPLLKISREDFLLTKNLNNMKCKVCGKEIHQRYYKDVQNAMNEHQMCFYCNFWREKLEQNTKQPPHKVAIIDGVHYYIDDENVVSEFRGFGGDKFVIHFNDGTEVVTTNLWCQGNISPQWREHFPDNATFDWEWKKIGNCNYLVPKEIPNELIG